MGISFAGVDLVVPTEDLRRIVEGDQLLRDAVRFPLRMTYPGDNSPDYSPQPKYGFEWQGQVLPELNGTYGSPLGNLQRSLFQPWWFTGAGSFGGYNPFSPFDPNSYGYAENTGEFWPLHLGAVRWPTGARRWAVGHFLATTEQLQEIERRLRTPVSQGSPGPGPRSGRLTLTDGADGRVDLTMYLQLARPLLGVPDANGLFLLVLVDDRYYWPSRRLHDVIEAGQGKIPQKENYPLETYWAFSVFAWYVLGTPDRYRFGRVHPGYGPRPGGEGYDTAIPTFVDNLATSIGSRILHHYDNGTFTQQHVFDGIAALRRNLVKYGHRFRTGGVTRTAPYINLEHDQAGTHLPSTFKFISPVWYDTSAHPNPLFDPLRISQETFKNHFYDEFPIAELFPRIQGTKGVDKWLNSAHLVPELFKYVPSQANWNWKDSYWYFDASYAARARLLARRMATDWTLFRMAPVDAVYDGILAWEQEGISDYIEWRVSERDVSTTVRRPPPDNLMLPLFNSSRETPELPLINTWDTFKEAIDRSGILGQTTLPVLNCLSLVRGTKLVLTVDEPVDGELISYVKDVKLGYSYLQIPNWYLSDIQSFRSGIFCASANDSGIECCPRVPCCAPNRVFPPFLYMRVVYYTGDCQCVLGFSSWMGGRGQIAPETGIHTAFFNCIIPFIACEPPGTTNSPPPWIGVPPEKSPVWGGGNPFAYPRLYLELGCLTDPDTGQSTWYLVTAGCNGYPGGTWDDFYYPAIRAYQCGPNPLDQGGEFFLLTQPFPVFECCRGQYSTTTAENFIQIAIAETSLKIDDLSTAAIPGALSEGGQITPAAAAGVVVPPGMPNLGIAGAGPEGVLIQKGLDQFKQFRLSE